MIKTKFNDSKFLKEMNNIVAYSNGFLDGTKIGKQAMLASLGEQIKELVGSFIDSNAKVDPASLHHVYEWYLTGSSEARLFDIDYKVIAGGLTVNGTLRQSSSVSKNSSKPFYNKARIMEAGNPVTITPKEASVLRFEVGGKEVFTKGPVTVPNPGGNAVAGSFENIFKTFFITYASQSILELSGLAEQLRNPIVFKTNFAAGSKSGRSAGISAGIKFISGGKR